MRIGPKLEDEHGREKENACGEGERQDVGNFVAMTEACGYNARGPPAVGEAACSIVEMQWLPLCLVKLLANQREIAFSSLSTTGFGSFA